MTAGDLIRAAGRLIAWHPGQSGNADEMSAALAALNGMLDAWNAQRLAVYSVRRDTFPLQTGKQSYTIGTGGDLNTERPARIERANVILPDGLHRPLELVLATDWAALRLPNLTSTFPTRLYYDRGAPLGTIWLWPTPTQANQIELFTWQKLPRFSALTDPAQLPEGYEEAVRYNLALRLAHELRVPIPEFVVHQARESMATIKRMNLPRPRLTTEPVMDEPRARFDWRLGE